MNKIILLRGLPASGKTTWSLQHIKDNPGTKRVNKDDLRAMLDGGIWSPENEDFVLMVRDAIVRLALSHGHDIIVDDTNLHSKHKNRLWRLASLENAIVETKSFMDVEPITCIERDMEREHPVGEEVIWKMFDQLKGD